MENLTRLQSKFLQAFFQTYLKKDFFLSGGTALSAFYLQHRVSDDIDLFTVSQSVEMNAVTAEVLKIIHRLEGKINNQVSTVTYIQFIFICAGEKLKVDVIKGTPVHFGKTQEVNNITVDSLENIAVGKLLALYGRAEAKDFVDLYFLLEIEKKIDFKILFNLAKKKDAGLSEFYLAGMMSKIEEIKYFPKTIRPVNEDKLRIFFLKLSKNLFKKKKPLKQNSL